MGVKIKFEFRYPTPIHPIPLSWQRVRPSAPPQALTLGWMGYFSPGPPGWPTSLVSCNQLASLCSIPSAHCSFSDFCFLLKSSLLMPFDIITCSINLTVGRLLEPFMIWSDPSFPSPSHSAEVLRPACALPCWGHWGQSGVHTLSCPHTDPLVSPWV